MLALTTVLQVEQAAGFTEVRPHLEAPGGLTARLGVSRRGQRTSAGCCSELLLWAVGCERPSPRVPPAEEPCEAPADGLDKPGQYRERKRPQFTHRLLHSFTQYLLSCDSKLCARG